MSDIENDNEEQKNPENNNKSNIKENIKDIIVGEFNLHGNNAVSFNPISKGVPIVDVGLEQLRAFYFSLNKEERLQIGSDIKDMILEIEAQLENQLRRMNQLSDNGNDKPYKDTVDEHNIDEQSDPFAKIKSLIEEIIAKGGGITEVISMMAEIIEDLDIKELGKEFEDFMGDQFKEEENLTQDSWVERIEKERASKDLGNHR